jgi:hypothetical protein
MTDIKHNKHTENVKPRTNHITSSEKVLGTGANCDKVEGGRQKGGKDRYVRTSGNHIGSAVGLMEVGVIGRALYGCPAAKDTVT